MPNNKKITFRKARQTESLELQLGLRLFAAIIDLMLIKLLIYPIVLTVSGGPYYWQTGSELYVTEVRFSTVFTFWLCFAILEGTMGATLGKLFVRLRIYNTNGSKLNVTKSIVRFPLKVLSLATLLGILMIDVNKEKQGLHDLLCGTIVRRK
ncbi:RDD family protein [Pararhodonellum marinum]|uniref:RDD family protein n=1 Tax=Pararhodonellum marinum TaxID=2755358 RepID=UPI0018909B97|nr:RDD family protein [Pararhodonellum marinum]